MALRIHRESTTVVSSTDDELVIVALIRHDSTEAEFCVVVEAGPTAALLPLGEPVRSRTLFDGGRMPPEPR
ncbi:hypothetical protein BH23ACT5_BH23ACT5_12280 [soil metagenome]